MYLPPLRLGVSTFITQHWMTPEDVHVIADSPVMSVEVAAPAMFETLPAQVSESISALRASALEPWSVHSPFGNGRDLSSRDEAVRTHSLNALRDAFGLAAELGCQVVVVHPSAEPVPIEERPARMQQAQRSLGDVVEMARERGVRAAMEPLPRTCLANTADEVAALLEGFPAEWLGICLDVNHANVGQDLVAFIRRFGARIISLHISDNDGTDEKHWLPGEGVIDWVGVIRALREVGCRCPFMYEVKPGNAGLAERLREFGENHRALMAQAL